MPELAPFRERAVPPLMTALAVKWGGDKCRAQQEALQKSLMFLWRVPAIPDPLCVRHAYLAMIYPVGTGTCPLHPAHDSQDA